MSRRRSPFPRTLKLLEGLRWKGKMRVMRKSDDGYDVQFDAEIVDPELGGPKIVYDHGVLSADQIKDWTGVAL